MAYIVTLLAGVDIACLQPKKDSYDDPNKTAGCFWLSPWVMCHDHCVSFTQPCFTRQRMPYHHIRQLGKRIRNDKTALFYVRFYMYQISRNCMHFTIDLDTLHVQGVQKVFVMVSWQLHDPTRTHSTPALLPILQISFRFYHCFEGELACTQQQQQKNIKLQVCRKGRPQCVEI